MLLDFPSKCAVHQTSNRPLRSQIDRIFHFRKKVSRRTRGPPKCSSSGASQALGALQPGRLALELRVFPQLKRRWLHLKVSCFYRKC